MRWLVCSLVTFQTMICCEDNPDPKLPSNPPPFNMTDLCVVKPFLGHDTSVEISFLWNHGSSENTNTKLDNGWFGRRFKTEATAVRAWTRDGAELRGDEFAARVKEHSRAVLIREPFGKRDSDLHYATYLSPETLLILPESWIERFRETSSARIKPPTLPVGSRAGTHP